MNFRDVVVLLSLASHSFPLPTQSNQQNDNNPKNPSKLILGCYFDSIELNCTWQNFWNTIILLSEWLPNKSNPLQEAVIRFYVHITEWNVSHKFLLYPVSGETLQFILKGWDTKLIQDFKLILNHHEAGEGKALKST